MTKKLLIIISLLLGVAINSRAAENAQSVLKHVTERITSQPVEATFTLKANGVAQDGSLTLSGNKFVAITPEMSTWYDGKTQWTLSPQINEVNITTPTHEELAEINPLLLLSSLSSNFNVEMGTSVPGCYVILLNARQGNSAISSFTVKVDSSTWFPKNIELLTSTGQCFTIAIKTIKNLKKVDNNIFRFNQSKYPGVEIIDLR